MNVRFCVLVSLLAACLVGCAYDRYVIEMKPNGDVLERRFSVSRTILTNEPIPEEELAEIVKLYPERVTRSGSHVNRFIGKFTVKTPNDVGGVGHFANTRTHMGSVGVYIERFRGNTDPAGRIEKRFRAADSLTDLLIGWFQSEMGEDARFGKLREFMDKEFRRDIKNASMYTSMYEADPENAWLKSGEVEMQLVRYLLERNYFPPEDLPEMVFVFNSISLSRPQDDILLRIQRFLATKMGIGDDQPVPDCLAFLSGSDKADKSLDAYLRNTEAFKKILRKWEQRRKTEPDLPKPESVIVLADLVIKIFELDRYIDNWLLRIFYTDDELEVRLALPKEPFKTNGQWNGWTGKVVWSGKLEMKASVYNRLPTLCYAVWAVPDKKFQRKHFGRIVLTDKALLEYCLWRTGLTDKESREWDDFVDQCRPGKSLPDRLRKFCFSDAPAETDTQPGSTSRAGGIIENIIKGLQNKR